MATTAIWLAGIGMIILPLSRILMNYIKTKRKDSLSPNFQQIYRIVAIVISFTFLGMALYILEKN